tara:strand:- start:140 stop:409 length:270 start_codon:yes stop_codon:yes gene_type:complete
MTTKEYIDLKGEIDELKKSVDAQNITLGKIHIALIGDKEFEQDGLVQLVKKHDNWIEKQKYMWAKIYGGILVGTTLFTYLMNYVIQLNK